MSSLFTVPELAIGVGLSQAASAAFEPKVEVPKQSAWATNPVRVPDLGLIAELVAGGKVSQADGHNMANRLGFSNGTMDSLVWLAQNRLDFPTVLRMWRLSAVNPAFDAAGLSALMDETLAHERLDWDYRPYLRALQTAELPGIGDIAYGVVRGILPAPSWVPVAPPVSGTSVPRFPQVNIDPVQLAAALGYDENMLQLLVGRSGLSLAPGLAANALFRGLINEQDFLLAIAEGDLRTEWATTLRDATRQILTAGEYAELELRGFLDAPTRRQKTQQHGMSDADSDLLYDVLGRAPAAHAITTGLARGGVYDGTAQTAPEPYLSAMQRGNIRPEYYSIEYANRYLYPSAFVLRTLAQAGELGDEAAVEQVLLELGWKPSFAKQVATAWVGGTGTADKHVAKAQGQLATTAHKSYVSGETTQADTETALAAAGIPAASVPGVIAAWNAERALIRKQLSPAQVKKAYSEGTFTLAAAQSELEGRGYSAGDANILLTE